LEDGAIKMSTFKDFFFSKKTKESMLPSPQQSIDTTSIKLVNILTTSHKVGDIILTNDKKQKFAEQVSQLAHSEDFIQTLSDTIGTPKSNESEDEFVERAKDTMRVILRKKLKG
jgi:hypothetical protein